MHILIAEDNPVNQLLIRAFCQAGGYAVDTVEDGDAALRAVQTGRYDLVLMDIHMPRVNGIEATRRIRALDGALAQLPILAVTADVTLETRQICEQVGVNRILTKPITLRTFLDAMREWELVIGGKS